MRGGSQAQYVPSGHLVYVAAGTLRAVAFDLDAPGRRSARRGPVVPQVVTLPTGTAEFDIAARRDAGVRRRRRRHSAAPRTLVWVDRQGREEAIKALRRARTSSRGCHRTGRASRSRSAIRRTISGSGISPARRSHGSHPIRGSIRRRCGCQMDDGSCSPRRRAAPPVALLAGG